MGFNFMDLIQLIRGGQNPQQLAMNIISQQGNNNPIVQNALGFANNGDINALLNLAKNLSAQKGLDFNQEFTNFVNSLR